VPNLPDAKFCENCGSSLISSTASPPRTAHEIYFVTGLVIMAMFVITYAYSPGLFGLPFLALLGWAAIVDFNL